jgi:hypothetical protein
VNSPRKRGGGGREGGKERVYVKIDSELLGERRREITGDLAYSSFSIMYFFSCNLGSPKGSACENESFFGEVTNLKFAMSTPDYCDNFFSMKIQRNCTDACYCPHTFSTNENPCN